MAAIDQLTATDPSIDWDPLVPLDDPYPAYRELRDHAPCYHHPGRDVWVLTRFDDIVAAAKDWETFSSSAGGTGNDVDDTYQLFLPAGDLPAADPPIHTRLRGALRLAFSPSALKIRFEPAVRAKVHELIDGFIDAGRADFAVDFARPLPATTMFTWFGFPDVDHAELLAWFDDMLQRTPGRRELPPIAIAARDRLRLYVQDVARDRRRAPGDDLMTFLVQAVDVGQLTDDELLGAALLAFVTIAAGTAAVLWVGTRHVLSGQLSVGDMVVFTSYLASLYVPLNNIFETYGLVQSAKVGVRRAFDILDSEQTMPEGHRILTTQRAKGEIAFEQVSFGYDSSRPILKEVNFRVAPGQRIAIVGPTGAGKSTLMSLLPRFYDPHLSPALGDRHQRVVDPVQDAKAADPEIQRPKISGRKG